MSRITARAQKDWTRFRIVLVGVVFGLALLGLWSRAFYVQIVQGPWLAECAVRQHFANEIQCGERGNIYDRKGRLLAKSVTVYSVYARPHEISDPDAVAAQLSQILGQTKSSITRLITRRASFVWVVRQIGDRPAHEIMQGKLPGIYLVTEARRLYPQGRLAGQLIGFVGIDGQGLEGLENSFERRLAGKKAEVTVQRDAAGRVYYQDEDGARVNINGQDLYLTLDAQIQYLAEAAIEKAVVEHNGKSGMCLVVDVSTGEILAWAAYPFFNPNVYREYDYRNWLNLPAMTVFEPGSTMKPFLIASALEEGVVTPDTIYYCENGQWKQGAINISDTHDYGKLPVSSILKYSSNIGAAKIGLDLGASRYRNYLSRLGFGEKTGLPLPGESRGVLRPVSAWTKVDLASASFGQGVGVTMAQMTAAYLCLANHGVYKPLRLVRDMPVDLPPEHRVFSPVTADRVMAMMGSVVQEDGTGTNARIPGVRVAGKTGTAQKASRSGGYGDKHTASFVAVIPEDSPRLLIVGMVDEPHPVSYGGVVVAPAVRDIAVNTLAYWGELPEGAGEGMDEQFLVKDSGESGEFRMARHASERRETAVGSVPDVCGLSVRSAMEMFTQCGVSPVFKGRGVMVEKQSPGPGQPWPDDGGEVVLWLSEYSE